MGNTHSIQTPQPALWRQYLELTKPRVVALMLLTVVVGMLLAQSNLAPIGLYFGGNLGIAMMSGSAAAINHVVDWQIDMKMARTANRPIAQGAINPTQAFLFALVLGVAGFGILWFNNNPLTAWLTLASLIGYALIYTLYLKRATSQNIVIGGLAGAMPPLLGWVAITGTIHPHALLLVLIIFIWTPPHFWALALNRVEEYKEVDIPMLPITHGEHYTRLQVLLYTLLLFVCTLLPWVAGMLDWLYLLGAIILGVGFIGYAIKVYRNQQQGADDMKTFKYSIIYLMLLFLIMLTDHFLL